MPAKPAGLQARACEQAAILLSLENLMTYAWIAYRVGTGALHLPGWYFDITVEVMLHYQKDSKGFQIFTKDSYD